MKTKLYCYYYKWNWDTEYVFGVSNSYAPQNSDNRIVIPLCEREVDIDLPEVDNKTLTLAEVERLQQQIQKEQAESHKRIVDLQDRINSLLAIESSVKKN